MQIKLSINHLSADKSPECTRTLHTCNLEPGLHAMTGYWMGIPCAAGENLLPLPVFLTALLSPAVWCVVTGTTLYHLTIIHFLPPVTHLAPCLVWILFILSPEITSN